MNEKKDSLRWMIIIVAAIAIIGIAGLFWWKSVAVIPNIVIPSPKMPNPNAFDYFNKAVGLMVDEKKISEAFQKTAKSSAAKPMTIADKEALLKRNAAALAMLR